MTDYIADIMDCGYTGKIDMEHKENILRQAHCKEQLCGYNSLTKGTFACPWRLIIFDFVVFRAIGLHVMTKRMPMLQQLREGLDLYGFSQVMQAKTEECRSLFVAGDDESVCCPIVFYSIVVGHGISFMKKEERDCCIHSSGKINEKQLSRSLESRGGIQGE